jgi:hypothetical protein
LINFGLFGLSDLEKSKPNQKTKIELAKILNRKTKPNNPKFNNSVQNQLNRFVCTPLSRGSLASESFDNGPQPQELLFQKLFWT